MANPKQQKQDDRGPAQQERRQAGRTGQTDNRPRKDEQIAAENKGGRQAANQDMPPRRQGQPERTQDKSDKGCC